MCGLEHTGGSGGLAKIKLLKPECCCYEANQIRPLPVTEEVCGFVSWHKIATRSVHAHNFGEDFELKIC